MKRNQTSFVCRNALAFGLLAMGVSAVAQFVGPSTNVAPYVLPSRAGVKTISILSVGEFVNTKPSGAPYYMVGIPDGMGAWEGRNGTFSLLMNHEIGAAAGVVRAHGFTGSFVSKWRIDERTFRVYWGEDLIQSTQFFGPASAFGRFCSGDLPDAGGGRGHDDDDDGSHGLLSRLYFCGEEVGDEGRAFATVVRGQNAGTAYELPDVGKMSFENVVAHPDSRRKTIVVSLDDSSPGQVYVYVGRSQDCGNEVERAGLTGGRFYGVKVPNVSFESRTSGLFGETRFSLHSFGNVSSWTGAQLQTASNAAQVTNFLRPEDGAWDPKNPRDFYFVTTDTFTDGRSRLYRLRFDDIKHPEQGGRIQMLLDGTEGQKMMDNMCVDSRGRVIIQEDPGGNDHLAKIWKYDIRTDSLTLVAAHNPYFFLPSSLGFLTNNEESSGVIEAGLGRGWYLVNVQAHYSIGGELVEGGQLLSLFIP